MFDQFKQQVADLEQQLSEQTQRCRQLETVVKEKKGELGALEQLNRDLQRRVSIFEKQMPIKT